MNNELKQAKLNLRKIEKFCNSRPLPSVRDVEFFAKIRYKNRLTRYSRVSDLGVTLPRCLRWLYPVLDGNRSLKEVFRSSAMKLQKRIEAFMEKFINSNLDRTLLVICGIIAITLIIAFTYLNYRDWETEGIIVTGKQKVLS